MCESGGALVSHRLSYGLFLYLLHDSEEVAAPYFANLLFTETSFKQTDGDVDEFAVGLATFYSASSIEIGADTYMVYAGYFYHVEQMLHEVAEGGTLEILGQEVGAGTYLYDSSFAGNGA